MPTLPPALPQNNLYQLLLVVFIVCFSLFIFALAYTLYYYLHKRHQPKKATVDPRDAAVQEAINIVDHGRQKAMELLKEAHMEARSILQGSDEIKTSTKELYEQKMQQVAQKQLEAFDTIAQELFDTYKNVITQEKDVSLKSLVGVSEDLKRELNTEVATFSQTIKQVTTQTEATLKEDFKNQYAKVLVELTNLADNLKRITTETESSMQSNLGGQYELVKTEISALSQNVKALTADTQQKIKDELIQEFVTLKNELSGISQGIQTITVDAEAQIRKEVDTTTDGLKSVTEGLKTVTDEIGTKIKEDISKEYDEAKVVVHDFSQTLKRAAEETENSIKQGIKQEYDKAKQDVADYRNDRYKKIDLAVRGVLEEVARDVIGKTLNAKDHEELIIRSLDSIKKSTNLKEL